MKNSTTVFIVIILILIAGAIYFSGMNSEGPKVEFDDNNGAAGGGLTEPAIEGNRDDLVSFSVKPNQKVSGVLNFEGAVRNAYFFEANIIIQIVDVNKNVLKTTNAMATTDWMTSEPVSFRGSIDLAGLPQGPAYLRIANDNASGLPENDKYIDIPIIIAS